MRGGGTLSYTHKYSYRHTHKGYKDACNERKWTTETVWLVKGKCKEENTHIHAAMCKLHADIHSYVQLRLYDYTVFHMQVFHMHTWEVFREERHYAVNMSINTCVLYIHVKLSTVLWVHTVRNENIRFKTVRELCQSAASPLWEKQSGAHCKRLSGSSFLVSSLFSFFFFPQEMTETHFWVQRGRAEESLSKCLTSVLRFYPASFRKTADCLRCVNVNLQTQTHTLSHVF